MHDYKRAYDFDKLLNGLPDSPAKMAVAQVTDLAALAQGWLERSTGQPVSASDILFMVRLMIEREAMLKERDKTMPVGNAYHYHAS